MAGVVRCDVLSGMEPDREGTNRTPRWVKIFGVVTIVVFLLFVVQLIGGGGRHGPNRHASPEASR